MVIGPYFITGTDFGLVLVEVMVFDLVQPLVEESVMEYFLTDQCYLSELVYYKDFCEVFYTIKLLTDHNGDTHLHGDTHRHLPYKVTR